MGRQPMTIPAAYQVGLGLYGIDAETLALRAEVWKILGPHLRAIMDTHFAGVRSTRRSMPTCSPSRAATIRASRETYRAHFLQSVRRPMGAGL